MTSPAFRPGTAPPVAPATADFRLEPLGPHHNEADHAAWTSSIDHIRSTPGFARREWGDDDWPMPMSAEDNLRDLVRHADEFARGEAFAYTVLDPADGDVIGCVYIDPDDTGAADAMVRSWVRADRAHLDASLADAVREWIQDEWPLASARFPGRRT